MTDNFILLIDQPYSAFDTIKIIKDGKEVHSFICEEDDLAKKVFEICYDEKIYDLMINYAFNFDLEEFINEVTQYEMNKYSENKIKDIVV